MKQLINISILFILFSCVVFSQTQTERTLSGYTPPDEMVTLSANIPFSKAIDLISKISEKKTGRRINSLVKRDDPIGIEIINVHYEKALNMIVSNAGLQYEKTAESYIIKSKQEPEVEIKPETFASFNSREIRISAVFFEMDITAARERGVNWQLLLSNPAGSFGTNVTTTGTASTGGTEGSTSSDFAVNFSNTFGLGGFFGQAISLFRYFETQNLGEIITSPSVTVRDRTKGRIQIGSDISFKKRDFSGNIIEDFYSTGSIVEVTPYVYKSDTMNYCLLDLNVERSTGYPTELTTEIKKTSAKTQVLMLDGEETVIGGLYLNEESTVRAGIPILKDLPWWVLGIRYLTGSDQRTVTKKELVIMIKVDILPTLAERFAVPSTDNPIEREVKNHQQKLKFYQFDNNLTPPEMKKDK